MFTVHAKIEANAKKTQKHDRGIALSKTDHTN